MASGDNVVQIMAVMPPAASAALMDVRSSASGTATPAENAHVYDFGAAGSTFLDYKCRLEGYDGGGLTLHLPFSMSSATTGSVVLDAAIRRLALESEDFSASHGYDYNSASRTVPSSASQITTASLAFTDGADMDSWAEGEMAILRVKRDGAQDDAAGDLELWGIWANET